MRRIGAMGPHARGGGRNIAKVGHRDVAPTAPAMLSVGFAPGRRPRVSDIATLASREESFTISHRPKEDEGWVELLVNGLTFDLTGLSPMPPSEPPNVQYRYGLRELRPTEAVALSPGPHISAGRSLPPVIRAAATLAMSLCRLEGAELVSWHPAQNAIASRAFESSVSAWLDGGAFPAMGLTSLYASPEGTMRSEGLKLFVGQELHLEGKGGSPAEDAKLAARLIDRLVQHGRLSAPVTWKVGEAQAVRLEPVGRGDIVRAWRQTA